MNCEWVERQLSAYHDSALDADTTAQVKNHLASCTQCDAVLDDYSRFDKAIATLPRVAPSPELRARIFASPEFQAIIRNERVSPAEQHAGAAPTATASTTRPHLLRAIAQIAAILVLLVGAGVVIGNIAAHNRHGGLIFAVCPELASGSRLVYRSGGTLHSGGAKLVCDAQVQVGAVWQVSPDGQWVAYVNATTGALRVVRSDATGDHIVDTGAGTVAMISWAPSSQRFAIIKHDDGNNYRILLARPEEGVSAEYTKFAATQLTQAPIWAPDSNSAAWTFTPVARSLTSPDSTGLDILGVSSVKVTTPVPVDGDLVAAGLVLNTNVSPDYPYLTYLTFAYQNDGVTNFAKYGFTAQGNGSGFGTPVAINDAKTVAFSSTTGKWAVAQGDGTITTVDALTGATTPLAHIDNVTQLTWSPSGTYLTATSGTTLWLITPTGVKRLGTNVSVVRPTWGQSDAQLGFIANSTVMTANVTTGTASPLTTSSAGAPTGLVWSADGQLVAWNAQGITVAGTTTATLLTEAPQWSVAG